MRFLPLPNLLRVTHKRRYGLECDSGEAIEAKRRRVKSLLFCGIRLKGILVDYISLGVKSKVCRCANTIMSNWQRFKSRCCAFIPTIQTPDFLSYYSSVHM